jgi:hypothetical protein
MVRWIVGAVLIAAVLMQPAQAQWKWRDKNGQTQYSDLPPPANVPEQDILSRPAGGGARRTASTSATSAAAGAASAASAGASTTTALAPKTVDPALEARRKQAEAEQADKKKADEAKVAAAKAENCTRAKEQLRSVDSGLRLARTNEKGEREILDDQQRAQEAKRIRDIIASECK